MAKENYQNLSKKELLRKLVEARDQLRDFRFRVARGRAKNVKEGRELRRKIAGILTRLNKLNKLDAKRKDKVKTRKQL
jgi:ribosomal protein L29